MPDVDPHTPGLWWETGTVADERGFCQTPAQRSGFARRVDRWLDTLRRIFLGLGLAMLAASVAAVAVYLYVRLPPPSGPLATAGNEGVVGVADAEGQGLGAFEDRGDEEQTGTGLAPESGEANADPGSALPVANGALPGEPLSLQGGGPGAAPLPAGGHTPTPGLAREPIKPLSYRVVEGDSLLAIARRFGITPETVLWANDIPNPQLLLVGQELKILPLAGVLHRVARGDTVAAIAERYGAEAVRIRDANGLLTLDEPREGQELVVPGGMMRTTEPFEAPPTAPPPPELLATAPLYTVKSGDTLVSIADAFGVLPSAIQAANGLLDPDLVKAGEVLAIPGGKEPDSSARQPRTAPLREGVSGPVAPLAASPFPSATVEPPVPTVAPSAPATAPPSPTPALPTPSPLPAAPTALPQPDQGQPVRYMVKPGDTLYSIARGHGVQPSALAAANGLSDPNRLVVGQVLLVPAGSPVAAGPTPLATARATQAAGSASPIPAASAPTSTQVPASATPRPSPSATTPPAPTAVRPTATSSAVRPTGTSTPARPTPTAGIPASTSPGERIAALSQKYVGYRYVWGGHSPTGFDCTGFTWYVYREAGLAIPIHDLQGQLGSGQKVARDKLLPGDLVFFENTYARGLSHVGIYLGSGRFINAETERVGVQVRSLSDPYWSSRYVGASRPW